MNVPYGIRNVTVSVQISFGNKWEKRMFGGVWDIYYAAIPEESHSTIMLKIMFTDEAELIQIVKLLMIVW